MDARFGYAAIGLSIFALVAACTQAPAIPDNGDDDGTGNDTSNSTGTKAPSSSSGSTSSSSSGGDPTSSSSSSSSSGSTSSSSGSTSSSSSGGTSSGGASGTPGTGATCSAQTTADGCYTCCIGTAESAYEIGDNAYGNCACATPGTCKTQCANTFCNGADPSADTTCTNCLDNATNCDTVADTACNADATCAQVSQCIQQAGCDNKN